MTVIETNEAGDHITESDYGQRAWATVVYVDPITWAEVAPSSTAAQCRTHWVHDNTAPNRRKRVAVTWHQADGQLHRLGAHGPAETVYHRGNINHQWWEHGKKVQLRESVWRDETTYGWTVTTTRHHRLADNTEEAVVMDVKYFDHSGTRLSGQPAAGVEYDAVFA